MSLSVTRNYSALNVLTEAQLDAAFDSIETKFNSTLIAGSEIQTGTIESGNLASNAVTTAKILDSNVTTAKIADGNVTSIKRLVTTTAKTTTYTATTADEFIACSTAGGTWTLTLYAASGNAGRKLIVKKTTSDTTALVIDGNASETIDEATTLTLNVQYSVVELLCDGSNWHVTQRVIPLVAACATGNPASVLAAAVIVFPTEQLDTHSAYDATTGRFTCPTAGIYEVGACGNHGATAQSWYAYKNAAQNNLLFSASASDLGFAGTTLISCAAGDVLDVRSNQTCDVAEGSLTFKLLTR